MKPTTGISVILVSVLISSLLSHSLSIVMAQTTTNATGSNNNATKSLLSQVAKLNKQGNDFISSGKYNESIANFDKALSLDPNYVFALLGKGYSLFKLGNYNGSIVYLDKVLSINPKNVNAMNLKTLVLAALNKTSNISKGLNVQPENTNVPSNNANILRIIIPSLVR
jgi:tetratricopeptide (TPR) repeat protein